MKELEEYTLSLGYSINTEDKLIECPKCNGSGIHYINYTEGDDTEELCTYCMGTGYL